MLLKKDRSKRVWFDEVPGSLKILNVEHIAIEERTRKLKETISLLELQIAEEELNSPGRIISGMDRMNYLKSKLQIFKKLLVKYSFASHS